jgi:protein-tyrosine kinase
MNSHNPLLVTADDPEDMGFDPVVDRRLARLAAERLAPSSAGAGLFGGAAGRPVQTTPGAGLPALRDPAEAAWNALRTVAPNPVYLERNNLFPDPSGHPAAVAIDLLRGRVLQALRDHGWSRVAITSPTRGCGKSLVAANLALSLARRPSGRVVLLDLDLRNPGLDAMLGVTAPGPMRDMLAGRLPPERQLLRAGRGLALGLNARPEMAAGEILLEPAAAQALDSVARAFAPEVVIYDLAPALGAGDMVAVLPQTDAVLLVADGTQTTAEEIRACERLFEGRVPLLGVVLNRAQDRGRSGPFRRGG